MFKIFNKGKIDDFVSILDDKELSESTKLDIIDVINKFYLNLPNYIQVKRISSTEKEITNQLKKALTQLEYVEFIPFVDKKVDEDGKEVIVHVLDNYTDATVDQKLSKISCYNNEYSIFYSLITFFGDETIPKIQDTVINKYSIINEHLKALILKGKLDSQIEILRDFTPYTWNVQECSRTNYIAKIIYTNLLYTLTPFQVANLINSNGKEVIDNLIKSYKTNFKIKKNDPKYEYISDIIAKLRRVIYLLLNDIEKKIIKVEERAKIQLSQNFQDNWAVLENISKNKIGLAKRLIHIQKEIELTEGNMLLSDIEKKNILSQLELEKLELKEKLDNYSTLQHPSEYLKYKDNIIRKAQYMDDSIELSNALIQLQESFLNIFMQSMKDTLLELENNDEKRAKYLVEKLYQLRYISNLRTQKDIKITDFPSIQKQVSAIYTYILDNMFEFNVLAFEFFDKANANKIQKVQESIIRILQSNILTFEDLKIQIQKRLEKDLETNKRKTNYYFEIWDDNVLLLETKIDKQEYNYIAKEYIKENKKVKLFTNKMD